MQVRAMRIIVMFDVNSVTKVDLKNYSRWHKFLVNSGFVMMTESVYSKLALNAAVAKSIKLEIKKNLPPHGNIQVLELTERQYNNIEYYLGEPKNDVLNTFERYTEI